MVILVGEKQKKKKQKKKLVDFRVHYAIGPNLGGSKCLLEIVIVVTV
jgi:hypothetical protein